MPDMGSQGRKVDGTMHIAMRTRQLALDAMPVEQVLSNMALVFATKNYVCSICSTDDKSLHQH